MKVEAKYQEIRNQLAHDIARGVYANGGRLPTCRELAQAHGASYLTANKAVRLLQDEGLATLIQGKGIFAVAPGRQRAASDKTIDSRRVAFLMPVKGDLFQNFFSRMLTILSNHGLSCLPLPGMYGPGSGTQWEQRAQFERHASQAMRSYIINGTRHFQFKIFKEFRGGVRHTVFVFHFDSAIDFPDANLITIDYREGGRLAARHLLDRGRRRIALVTFEQMSAKDLVRHGAVPSRGDAALEAGIKEALEGRGLDAAAHFSILRQTSKVSKSADSIFRELFRAGVDGFVCHGDSRAAAIYRAAQSHGFTVGKDIGVVGYFNTPWCEMFTPNLSSVSVMERKIADLAAKAVLKNWQGKRIVVTPRLVARGSA